MRLRKALEITTEACDAPLCSIALKGRVLVGVLLARSFRHLIVPSVLEYCILPFSSREFRAPVCGARTRSDYEALPTPPLQSA